MELNKTFCLPMYDISIFQGSEAQVIFILETKRPITTIIIGHNISIKKLFKSLMIKYNLRIKVALKSLQNLLFFEKSSLKSVSNNILSFSILLLLFSFLSFLFSFVSVFSFFSSISDALFKKTSSKVGIETLYDLIFNLLKLLSKSSKNSPKFNLPPLL